MHAVLFTFIAASVAVAGLPTADADYPSTKAPPGSLALPLVRILNQGAYAIELDVGTPPQKMLAKIDTGSTYTGLQGTTSNWCQLRKKPCDKYGSYNNLTSSTAVYENGDFFNTLINQGYGSYINDTFTVGGKTFPNVSFGMITYYGASFPAPKVNAGLVGLGPTCINTACTNISSQQFTLQQHFVSQGYVRNNVLSIYLGPDHPNASGELLFSAVDRAKQEGESITIPVIDPVSPISNNAAIYTNFSSMSVSTKDGLKTPFNISAASYAFYDTGNPTWSVPTPVYQYLASYFHVGPNSRVDCKFRKQQADNATLSVGFSNGKETVNINVPLYRLVTQLSSTHCIASLGNCGDGTANCVFGDVFFRNAYTTFDFDKLTVTFSNVKYTTKRDIVVV